MRPILYLIFMLIELLWKLSKRGGSRALVAECLILRQQLQVVRRKRIRAPKLTGFDRVVFAVASLFISSKRLPKLSVVVAHSTLLKFHRALVKRKYSALFSNKIPRKPGPKGPSSELIKIVIETKQKNPLYGCPRIAMLVSQLSGQEIDEHLVRRILRKHPHYPGGGGPSWLAAIGKAKDQLWSLDMFCVESITLQTFWIMIIMDQFTRQIIGFAVHRGSLDGPSACWMFQRARNGRKPKYLSTDHDPLFEFHRWKANLRILDIEEIKSVPEVPWSHPFIERLIGTTRREYLDDTLFWNESDLISKLNLFTKYYNEARVHYSLQGKTPAAKSGGPGINKIDLKNYRWKNYCGGKFSIPIAA